MPRSSWPGLELPTRQVATVLGFHPEHVRRLIRSGRLRARRVGGDYRVSLDDLWALLEVRYREPGRRRAAAPALTMVSLRVVPSAELTPAEWSTLTDLCVAAFDEPWDSYWQDIGPGVHVLAEDPERGIVGHAAIVDRLLYPGEATLRSGYVEAVAVWPDLQVAASAPGS